MLPFAVIYSLSVYLAHQQLNADNRKTSITQDDHHLELMSTMESKFVIATLYSSDTTKVSIPTSDPWQQKSPTVHDDRLSTVPSRSMPLWPLSVLSLFVPKLTDRQTTGFRTTAWLDD